MHAKCDDGIGLGSKIECRTYDTFELLGVHHHMIARSDNQIGLWVFLLDAPADVGNTRRGVASTRFEQDILLRNLR